jgi:hypothetical protein
MLSLIIVYIGYVHMSHASTLMTVRVCVWRGEETAVCSLCDILGTIFRKCEWSSIHMNVCVCVCVLTQSTSTM